MKFKEPKPQSQLVTKSGLEARTSPGPLSLVSRLFVDMLPSTATLLCETMPAWILTQPKSCRNHIKNISSQILTQISKMHCKCK